MGNPFRERNLMSARDNPYMRAYRENPARVREILETARHSAVPDRQDVKNWVVEPMSNAKPKIALVVAPIVSISMAGCITHCIMPYNLSQSLAILSSSIFVADFIRLFYGYHREEERGKQYAECKEQADKILGYKRVERNPQLEFLFD